MFGFFQFAIGISALSAHFLHNNLSHLFTWFFYVFRDIPFVFFAIQYLIIFVIILIPTSLMGACFPLAMKAYTKDFDKVAEDTGSLYSINTIGSVIGAILCGFLLIPYLGLDKTEVFASLVNMTIAILMFSLLKDYKKLVLISSVYALVLAVYLLVPLHHPLFNVYLANRFESQDLYNISDSNSEIIWEKEDVEGTVQVARGGNPPMYGIRIKGIGHFFFNPGG